MAALLAPLVPAPADLAWLLAIAGKAALLLAASWLAAALLRRGPAAARHQLWALGVGGALLLPLLAWAMPALPLLSGTLPALPLALAPSAAGGSHTLVATVIVGAGGRTTAAAPSWPSWLALVWAAGTLLVALRLGRGHLAARRLWRTADRAVPASWSSAWREAAGALALAGVDVGLGRSLAIRSPMTVGVLRPRVLLPIAADGWAPARLRAVFTHELGHVRRRDTLVQLGAQLACALYWWNPLAWLAAARLRIEREHACDDLVLDAGVQPSSYAADLLEVARALAPGAAPAGAIGMVDRSWTEARLHRILDPGTSRRPLGARFRLAVGAVALVAAVTLACTSSPRARPSVRARPAAAIVVGPAVAPADRPAREAVAHGPARLRDSSIDPRSPTFTIAPALEVWGALEPSLVEREVKRHLGDLEQCYQRRLLVHPALAGTVVMHWTVSATGAVAEQCITEDTVGDADLRACVNALVASTRYPAPGASSVNVAYPFTFSPASG